MRDRHEPLAASVDRYLSWPEVRAITGLGRTTIWRLQKAGDFPKAVQISPRRIAWRASDLAAWLQPEPEPETARTAPAAPRAASRAAVAEAPRASRAGTVPGPRQLTLGLPAPGPDPQPRTGGGD